MLLNFEGKIIDHRNLPKPIFQSIKRASIYIEPKPSTRSPDLDDILYKAQIKIFNREFNKTLNTHDPQEKKDLKLIYSLVNILFSAVSVVTAILYIESEWRIETRVVAALFFATVIIIAEGYFFTRDWTTLDKRK